MILCKGSLFWLAEHKINYVPYLFTFILFTISCLVFIYSYDLDLAILRDFKGIARARKSDFSIWSDTESCVFTMLMRNIAHNRDQIYLQDLCFNYISRSLGKCAKILVFSFEWLRQYNESESKH